MIAGTALRRAGLLLLVTAGLFFLYFFGLTRTGLIGPDEPRYAAIGRAMAATGDWITPRLWGQPWFEKPVLLYWMTAAGFKTGLGAELAPRLPVALASVAFLIYFFVVLRREFGERAAWYSATILATSAGWLAYSHVGITDLPMSAAFAAAMLELLPEPGDRLPDGRGSVTAVVMPSRAPAAHPETTGSRALEDIDSKNTGRVAREQAGFRTRRSLIAGAFLGLAVLAKGLVPLALFIPALWFLRRRIRDLALVFLAAIVVAAPWYALVMLRNGAPFVDEFFWKQHFSRFVSGALQHGQPIWFYLPVLLAGLFPWTPLLALLFSGRLFQDRRAQFLLAWSAWGFLFFSVSRNKLPGYLLPLLPPIATLLGSALAAARSRILLAACGALFCIAPPLVEALPQALLNGISHVSFHWNPAWILGCLVLAAVCALGRRDAVVVTLAVLATLTVAWMVWRVYPELDRRVSGRWLAESMTCLPQTSRSQRYSIDYYAGQDLPDCK